MIDWYGRENGYLLGQRVTLLVNSAVTRVVDGFRV